MIFPLFCFFSVSVAALTGAVPPAAVHASAIGRRPGK